MPEEMHESRVAAHRCQNCPMLKLQSKGFVDCGNVFRRLHIRTEFGRGFATNLATDSHEFGRHFAFNLAGHSHESGRFESMQRIAIV